MPGPAPGEPADADLLRRHVSGDPEAFGTLFTRHKDRLWAVALRVVCDPDDAADALQEAMLSAFRRAGDFRGESAVTTWLHRIVVNASLDLLRRRSAKPVSGLADTDEAVPARWDPGGPSWVSRDGITRSPPGTDVIDTRIDVNAALRAIPPAQRAALVLVDMLGYSVADTALILGVCEGTVKSRCARGRARLLPYVSHLRAGNPAERNHPAVDGVSPEREGGA